MKQTAREIESYSLWLQNELEMSYSCLSRLSETFLNTQRKLEDGVKIENEQHVDDLSKNLVRIEEEIKEVKRLLKLKRNSLKGVN